MLISKNRMPLSQSCRRHKAPMKIAIASLGRFHVLDLARELSHLGNDVAFYSDVPAFRLKKFGFAAPGVRTLWTVTAMTAAARRARTPAAKQRWGDRQIKALESAILRNLTACDTFIGLSGITLDLPGECQSRAQLVRSEEHTSELQSH